MTFIKANLILLIIIVVSLLSIGGGAYAFMQGSDTEDKMRAAYGLIGKMQSLQANPINKSMVEARREEKKQEKVEFETSMASLLEMQKGNPFYEPIDEGGRKKLVPRKPLIDDVLTPEAKPSLRIQFREAYKREFDKLPVRLHSRGGPTVEEITAKVREINQGDRKPDEDRAHPWMPAPAPAPKEETKKTPDQEMSLPELLRAYPPARAAEDVARKILMYIEPGAFGIHDLAARDVAPTQLDIWQAQMLLWIQQDMAVALASCNEERIAELKKQGVAGPYWVGQMPVKHLKLMSIDAKLGRGSGSNPPRDWPVSFTEVQNDPMLFVVPVQLNMIVEEAALLRVLDHLTRVGFYTPTRVNVAEVILDPTFLNKQLFVYGDHPVIDVTIDLEGYYFRQIYEDWIPAELKQMLQTPAGREDRSGRDRG